MTMLMAVPTRIAAWQRVNAVNTGDCDAGALSGSPASSGQTTHP